MVFKNNRFSIQYFPKEFGESCVVVTNYGTNEYALIPMDKETSKDLMDFFSKLCLEL